jgi:MFS family permease
MVVGSLLFAVGFGALAIARSPFEVALTVVIWTFGEMVLFPSMSAYVSDIAPEGKRGEYMGLYMMAFSFAFMAGPWLGMTAFEHFGATWFWSATLGVGVLSSLLLGLLKQGEPAPVLAE